MTTARRYLVSGRVQGVGFRMYVRDAAQREGIRGSVRNLPDGRVEAEAYGDGDALGRFEQALRQGPPLSRIDGITVQDRPASHPPASFRIE